MATNVQCCERLVAIATVDRGETGGAGKLLALRWTDLRHLQWLLLGHEGVREDVVEYCHIQACGWARGRAWLLFAHDVMLSQQLEGTAG